MREMKDSGIEWLEDIPIHWEIIPNKWIMKKKKEICSTYHGEDILSLTMNGVIIRDLTAGGKMPATFDGYQRLTAGNLLMCLFDIDVTPRCIGLIKNDGLSSPAYSQFVLNEKGYAPYYYYYYLNLDHTKELLHMAKNLRHSLTEDQLGEISVAVPPYEEQIRIVDALEEKLPQVDHLITNVQAQIDKLKAYKQSLITEVVTKGLDPSAPMKDSGVDWIGEIPMHWNIVATKYLFEIFSGATPKSEIIANWDGNIIWITPADYKTDDVFVSCGRRNLSEQGFASCSTSIIPANSIIFSKRAPIGAVAINTVELCTNQGCLSCVNKDESNINAKFFYYVMAIATEHYELLGSGTTFKEISASNFANFVLPWPAIDEQIAMVEYLDDKCTMIAQLIAIKQKKINKLTEYKKSIIYEYVTGKKEVS